MDHPTIEQIERTGYPREMFEQDDHAGIDALGDEILWGDTIIDIDGEIVLQENLERYVVEMMGGRIREAQ